MRIVNTFGKHKGFEKILRILGDDEKKEGDESNDVVNDKVFPISDCFVVIGIIGQMSRILRFIIHTDL